MDDQPGRNDWVLGSVRDSRTDFGNCTFSCSVNLRTGDVRSVDDASPRLLSWRVILKRGGMPRRSQTRRANRWNGDVSLMWIASGCQTTLELVPIRAYPRGPRGLATATGLDVEMIQTRSCRCGAFPRPSARVDRPVRPGRLVERIPATAIMGIGTRMSRLLAYRRAL